MMRLISTGTPAVQFNISNFFSGTPLFVNLIYYDPVIFILFFLLTLKNAFLWSLNNQEKQN